MILVLVLGFGTWCFVLSNWSKNRKHTFKNQVIPNLSVYVGDTGGREDGGSDGERRRSSTNAGQYSDDHQLFLGNLPLDASENDLRVSYLCDVEKCIIDKFLYHHLFYDNILFSTQFLIYVYVRFQNLFKRFGTIVDLRIMSKPNNMKGQPGGNKVPNYGFIIFDSVQTVHDVLAARVSIKQERKEKGKRD